jgi:hypothetical protein
MEEFGDGLRFRLAGQTAEGDVRSAGKYSEASALWCRSSNHAHVGHQGPDIVRRDPATIGGQRVQVRRRRAFARELQVPG